MWVQEIIKRTKTLLAQFHDEVILDVPCAYREGITKLLKECVKEVNKKLNLNRELDVDVDFGKTYAEIH
jgi:DNA polymerase I-like protein with 3'-5' exonuclease and polymerase domains